MKIIGFPETVIKKTNGKICMKKLLLAIVFAVSALCAQNSNEITWLHPKPTGVPLRFIQYIDSNTIVTGGTGGVFLKSTDRGETFTATYGAYIYTNWATFHTINTGYFINHSTGFLGGVNGVVKTSDGGKTFFQSSGPEMVGSTILKMKFRDSLNGYAVGVTKVFETNDAGNSWHQINSIVTNGWKWGIELLDENRIVISGDYYAGSNIHVSTDGGQTWSDYAAGTGTVYSIKFANAMVGYCATAANSYKTTDGGVTWENLALSNASGAIFTQIQVKKNVVCFFGDKKVFYRSTDDGATFTEINFSSPALSDREFNVQAADYAGNNWVIAAGAGTVYRSFDDGLTWTTKSSYDRLGGLKAMWGSRNSGRIVGVGAAVSSMVGQQFVVSTNYGETWYTQDASRDLSTNLSCITMVTEQTGYACGTAGKVFKTINGGLSWDSVGSTNNINALRWMDFGSENTGIVIGNNNFSFKTTDGGQTWNTFNFPMGGYVTGIKCIDSVTYLAASPGNNIISKTTDGGTTWTSVPVNFPTYSPVGNIRMYNKKFGLVVGTAGDLIGYLFKTTDGGNSWSELSMSYNSSTLWDVAIRDTSDFIISGLNGLLIRTTNGGETWNRLESGTSGDILKLDLPHRDTLLFCHNEANSAANIVKLALTSSAQLASIIVTAPNGGEIVRVGAERRISWNSALVTDIKLEYTTNDGENWISIVDSMSSGEGYYNWRIPVTPSKLCRVKISDFTNPMVCDSSDNVFTIDVPATSFWVPVNSNLTSNIWSIDYASDKVIWICGADGAVGKSTDNGNTFAYAGAIGVPSYGIVGLSELEAIVATAPNTGNGQILKTTNGGTSWFQVYTATGAWFNLLAKTDSLNMWALSDPIAGKYPIVKTTDGGNNWKVCPNLPTPPPNGYGAVGGYDQIGNTLWFASGGLDGVTTTNKVYKSTNGPDGPWTVTSTTHPNPAAISFSTPDGKGLTGFWDISGIMNRTTDGGNAWMSFNTQTGPAHTMQYIRGSSTAYLASTNGLYKTSDDGETWGQELFPVGVFGEPLSVRLHKNGQDGIVGGVGGFLLRKVAATTVTALTLVTPNGGEKWDAGTKHNISWYSYNTPTNAVKIEYSTNNGVSWTIIAANVPANQVTYEWTLPQVNQMQQALVRVTDIATGSVNDLSDSVFAIMPTIGTDAENIRVNYALSQNYPNPFNPTTSIKFAIPEKTQVTITVYNTLGEKVSELLNTVLEAGNHQLEWNAVHLSSGVYFYELNTTKYRNIKKMILTK